MPIFVILSLLFLPMFCLQLILLSYGLLKNPHGSGNRWLGGLLLASLAAFVGIILLGSLPSLFFADVLWLIALITYLTIGVVTAWVVIQTQRVSSEKVHIPLTLDTAVFGLLVFADDWSLLEANQLARQMLDINWEPDMTLFSLLDILAEEAVNKEGILSFASDTAVSFAEERSLGVILPAISENHDQVWLLLQFKTLDYDDGSFGYLCTIENQTAVRQTQAQLEAVNKSLEAFAFQATLFNDIIRTAISNNDLHTMLQRFVDRLGDMFNAVGCYITTWDVSHKRANLSAVYKPVPGNEGVRFLEQHYHSLTQAVLESGQYLVAHDLKDLPRINQGKSEFISENTLLVLPLISNIQDIGAIFILFSGDEITSEQITMGRQVASHIALAISKVLILEAERAQRELAETLREISLILTSALDMKTILDSVLEQIARVVPYDSASITLLENGNIEIARLRGLEKYSDLTPEEIIQEGFSIETTLTFQIMLQEQRPLLISDTAQFEGWQRTRSTQHIRSWIGVPLLIDGEVRAFLTLDKTEPEFYQEGHRELLVTFAQQVAIALQRAQWYEESQRWAHQLATLNDLSAEMVGMIKVQPLADLVVNRLCQDFHYDNVVVFMIDPAKPTHIVLRSMAGIYAYMFDRANGLRLSIYDGLMGLAVTQKKFVLENNAQEHPEFRQMPDMDIHSELVIPIKIEGEVLGIINIDSTQKDAFNENDVVLITIVADQLAVAVQKARLFELTERRAEELEILSVISAQLRSAHTVAEMLNIILENSVKAIQAEMGVIALIDREQKTIVSRGVYPWGAYPIGLVHQFDEGVTGYVASTGQTYISSNFSDDPKVFYLEDEEKLLENIHCSISLPLQTEKTIIGVIHIGLTDSHTFTEADEQLMTSIADISANALYRANVIESLEERVDKRTRDLQEAYGRLKELDRLKSKFISDITHELRTPVANLNLYLDLIKAGKPENRERYMNVIENQSARLTQIVENTLQMPHLESGNGIEFFQLVDIEDLVTTAVSSFRAKAEAKELELSCQIQSDLPYVLGDSKQIDQVIRNVLSNAINYTYQGQVFVEVHEDEEDDLIRLTFTDTGIGIDEEDLPYLFERFYRGQKVGQSNVPGMGLGLAFVKEIVELHNGRVVINSQPDQGTTCIIWFPASNRTTNRPG